jgi:hypothetical protein
MSLTRPADGRRGGRIAPRIFGRKHWRPAQAKAGIDPVRGLYDLRHTYATFALRAGVPVFAVSRFMGTSIAIDRPPLRPPRQRQPRPRSRPARRSRLRAGGGRCVDVAAAASEAAQSKESEATHDATAASRGRSVDAAPRLCRLTRRRKKLISRDEAKPSDGLEPSTPSLPCGVGRKRWQSSATARK